MSVVDGGWGRAARTLAFLGACVAVAALCSPIGRSGAPVGFAFMPLSLVVLAAVGHRVLGERAVLVAVGVFALLLPWFALGAYKGQDVRLLGGGETCGFGREQLAIAAAKFGGLSALIGGGIGLMLPARASTPVAPRMRAAGATIAVLVVTGSIVVMTGLATLQWLSRPSAKQYTTSLSHHARIGPRPSLVTTPTRDSLYGAREVLYSDEAIEVTRACHADGLSCTGYLDLRDGFGAREAFDVEVSSDLTLKRDAERGLWSVTVTYELWRANEMGFLAGQRNGPLTIRSRHVRGAIGPPSATVALALAACGLLGATAYWLIQSRRRLKKALSGSEASLRPDGWLELDGAGAPIHVEGHDVPPGPVIYLATEQSADYRGRATASPEMVLSGTKSEWLAAHQATARILVPVALVAALYLAAPLFAAARLGMVF
ncbi:MAG: hypothetical protein HOW73_27230 [Polyangiaceae bacterium]|nr:hypothetical protein [Polyangiaceae bacterium]